MYLRRTVEMKSYSHIILKKYFYDMFNILTSQQRNPAGERTLGAITKNLKFRIHRYHTKCQKPRQYFERMYYINWSYFHPLFIEILRYHKTCLVGRCFLFVKQLSIRQANEELFCRNHKPQEWMACREGWAVVKKLRGTFCTCLSSFMNVFYPFSHSKPRTLLQILSFH